MTTEPAGATETAGEGPASARAQSLGERGTPLRTNTPGAPTAAEIRAEVAAAGYDDQLKHVIADWSAALWSAAYEVLESPDPREPDDPDDPDDPSTLLWDDLRISEAVDLRHLVRRGVERAAERCQAAIVEELTAAGVEFAAKHPDAPRARVS